MGLCAICTRFEEECFRKDKATISLTKLTLKQCVRWGKLKQGKLEAAILRLKKADLDDTDEEDVDEHEPDDHEEDFDVD